MIIVDVIKAILLLNTVMIGCLLWNNQRLEEFIYDLFMDIENLEKLIKRCKDGDTSD